MIRLTFFYNPLSDLIRLNYNLNRDHVEYKFDEITLPNITKIIRSVCVRVYTCVCVCVCVSRIIFHIEFQRNSLTILSRNIHRVFNVIWYSVPILYSSFFYKTIVLYTVYFLLTFFVIFRLREINLSTFVILRQIYRFVQIVYRLDSPEAIILTYLKR